MNIPYINELLFLCALLIKCVVCEIEYNTVNPDGSFAFRHINNDIGSYYHSAAGNPNNSIRGRYGSRNPSTGKVEETIYTAGARGFRVNGPQVHRKMDLSQIPRGAVGSLDDPLADPYDDPTYSFSFKTPEYNRNENADSTGRITGLYSYLDDIGERHTVRYAAGAGSGFEVINNIPDNPSRIAYSAPLYKASPKARGKISIQRGPKGLYKFIATGPDQRRTEVSGPDGIIRGAYSYLDDKGVQRTVKYEAGAGIGYRIIQNTIGRGSHINTNIPDLLSNVVYSKDYLQSSNVYNVKHEQPKNPGTYVESSFKNKDHQQTSIRLNNAARRKDQTQLSKELINKEHGEEELNSKNVDKLQKLGSKHFPNLTLNQHLNQTQNNDDIGKNYQFDSFGFDDDLSSITPLITSNRRILEIGREKDWNSRNRDSTIITNVGKWFVGLPPGQSVRAHVQHIDILPIGGRLPSPSDALRKDELSELIHA